MTSQTVFASLRWSRVLELRPLPAGASLKHRRCKLGASGICMMDNGECGKFPRHLLSSRIMRIPEGASVTPASI